MLCKNLIIDEKYFNLEIDPRFPLKIPENDWQCFTNHHFIRPKKYFIYLIKCNEHLYVGHDKNSRRIGGHKSSLKNKYHKNSYLQYTFNKYGIENFYYFPLVEIPEEYLKFHNQIENSYIKLFNTFKNKNPNGLNLVEFADTPWLGRTFSKEHREKIGKSNTGKKHSLEMCLHLSQQLKGKYTGKLSSCWGRHQTPEAKAKIAEAMRNRVVSKETRRRQSESHKGRLKTERHILLVSKTYTLIDPDGKTVQIINMAKFAKENKLNAHIIRKVSYGIRQEYRGWKTPHVNE